MAGRSSAFCLHERDEVRCSQCVLLDVLDCFHEREEVPGVRKAFPGMFPECASVPARVWELSWRIDISPLVL
jgi:hypothetical protein